jgi:hypothetical protein
MHMFRTKMSSQVRTWEQDWGPTSASFCTPQQLQRERVGSAWEGWVWIKWVAPGCERRLPGPSRGASVCWPSVTATPAPGYESPAVSLPSATPCGLNNAKDSFPVQDNKLLSLLPTGRLSLATPPTERWYISKHPTHMSLPATWWLLFTHWKGTATYSGPIDGALLFQMITVSTLWVWFSILHLPDIAQNQIRRLQVTNGWVSSKDGQDAQCMQAFLAPANKTCRACCSSP